LGLINSPAVFAPSDQNCRCTPYARDPTAVWVQIAWPTWSLGPALAAQLFAWSPYCPCCTATQCA